MFSQETGDQDMHLNRVLFRVDAGPHIGLGHLQRSLALAAASRQKDVESTFLTNDDNGSRERAAGFGFPVVTLPHVESWTSEDADAAVKVASQNGCDAVVVDSHEAHADYLTQLRDAGLYVIKRDDLAHYPFPCQMVINGNADACQLPYRSSSGDTLFLLGPGVRCVAGGVLGFGPTRDG